MSEGNKMENRDVKEIKNLIKRNVEDAKQECFAIANPNGLEYDQLSGSEKTLYDLCYYLDGYDNETLEKLIEIIGKMFYDWGEWIR